MKKVLGSIGAALGALAVIVAITAGLSALTPRPVHAQNINTPVRSMRYAYESPATGAGAIITSPVIDGSRVESLVMAVDASAAGTGKSLQVNCLAQDATTVLYAYPAVSVASGARAQVVMKGDASSVTAPTGTTVWGAEPCARLQASIAAAGAGTTQLAIYGR